MTISRYLANREEHPRWTVIRKNRFPIPTIYAPPKPWVAEAPGHWGDYSEDFSSYEEALEFALHHAAKPTEACS